MIKENKLQQEFNLHQLDRFTFIVTFIDTTNKEFHTFHINSDRIPKVVMDKVKSFGDAQELCGFVLTIQDTISVIDQCLMPTVKIEDIINYANLNNQDRSLIYNYYVKPVIERYTKCGYKYVEFQCQPNIDDYLDRYALTEHDRRRKALESSLQVYDKAMELKRRNLTCDIEELENKYCRTREQLRVLNEKTEKLKRDIATNERTLNQQRWFLKDNQDKLNRISATIDTKKRTNGICSQQDFKQQWNATIEDEDLVGLISSATNK